MGKQQLIYLRFLCKWMAEEGEEDMVKDHLEQKRQEIVEGYDRTLPEGTWHIKKEYLP